LIEERKRKYDSSNGVGDSIHCCLYHKGVQHKINFSKSPHLGPVVLTDMYRVPCKEECYTREN
jgi:hypothetical protein